jgi:hypothetical protein
MCPNLQLESLISTKLQTLMKQIHRHSSPPIAISLRQENRIQLNPYDILVLHADSHHHTSFFVSRPCQGFEAQETTCDLNFSSSAKTSSSGL